MANKYSAAGLDVARRAKRLIAKWHQPLLKARVRIDFLFVVTDGEDGCALKCNGYPALAVSSVITQRDRVGLKADARVILDKEAWDELSDKQKDAMLDHELQHFEPVMKEETIALDGNDRPKLRLRKHDVQIGWFKCIAERHGEASQEVLAARAIIENASAIFLPGFEFTAKRLPGQRAVAALPARQAGNIIDISATKPAEKLPAAAK